MIPPRQEKARIALHLIRGAPLGRLKVIVSADMGIKLLTEVRSLDS